MKFFIHIYMDNVMMRCKYQEDISLMNAVSKEQSVLWSKVTAKDERGRFTAEFDNHLVLSAHLGFEISSQMAKAKLYIRVTNTH